MADHFRKVHPPIYCRPWLPVSWAACCRSCQHGLPPCCRHGPGGDIHRSAMPWVSCLNILKLQKSFIWQCIYLFLVTLVYTIIFLKLHNNIKRFLTIYTAILWPRKWSTLRLHGQFPVNANRNHNILCLEKQNASRPWHFHFFVYNIPVPIKYSFSTCRNRPCWYA